MARNTPFSDAEKMRIRVLHGRGWSATRIAKDLKRSTRGVTRIAATMHLHFDHAQTELATKTAAIDQRARRARIAARLLDESEELLDDLHRPYLAYTFIGQGEKAGEFAQHAAMPGPRDKADLTRGVAGLMGEHRRLAEFDAGDDGAKAARSMLRSLASALSVAVDAEDAQATEPAEA